MCQNYNIRVFLLFSVKVDLEVASQTLYPSKGLYTLILL